ncbi:hypothetical protein H5410_015735 [Solanum commersonii]|uniref:Uncharacterized protein n=1 Tax=Solanum commersonii TaxID=4109 RepID=A0A9J5ZVE3_SOLCO|nr:hypothetical protein H5410_015735 [Solanum commersonii]
MNGNEDYSCVVRPCPYCKGAHFCQQCHYIPEGELCSLSLSCKFCRCLWVGYTVCCYPTPKPSHDDANKLCSFDSIEFCRKLIEEYEERHTRVIYVMSRLIDRKLKHIQDVDMFFLHTQNLSNELNAKVATFYARQFNYEFCDTEKALRSQIEDLDGRRYNAITIFLKMPRLRKSSSCAAIMAATTTGRPSFEAIQLAPPPQTTTYATLFNSNTINPKQSA